MNKVGPFEELTIFYHPLNNRHLGFARVVFNEVKHAKLCIEKYNGKSVMGKVCRNISVNLVFIHEILGWLDEYTKTVLFFRVKIITCKKK